MKPGSFIAWASVLLLAGAARLTGAAITLPASEVFSPDEGTFEIWFRPDGGLEATPETDFYSPFSFLSYYNTKGRRENALALMYRVQKRKASAGSSASLLQEAGIASVYRRDLFFRIGDVVMTVPANKLNWQEGQWQCLAVTWKQQGGELQLQLYNNGKLVSQLARPDQTLPGTDGELVIGSRNEQNPQRVTLAAYRFSKRVLDEAELARAATQVPPLTADPLKVETLKELTEENTKTLQLPSGGVLSGPYHIVSGPNGPALQMY